MHTLLFVRHAKSDRSTLTDDFKRPLNHRGAKDAPVMAKRLEKRKYRPDMMISSDALRAKSTAEAFTDALGAELILNHDLYNADEKKIIKLIRNMDENVKELMLVGHNPTWEILVEYFTKKSIELPTCSIVQIGFDCKWEKIKKGSGKIIHFDYPKKEKR